MTYDCACANSQQRALQQRVQLSARVDAKAIGVRLNAILRDRAARPPTAPSREGVEISLAFASRRRVAAITRNKRIPGRRWDDGADLAVHRACDYHAA